LALTCPNCGNAETFLVKTLQMHLVRVSNGQLQPPQEEGRPAVGLELVRYAAANATLPWFAIGGIDASNVADVVAAGATKVAVVRAIVEADDPERAARELCEALPG